MQIEEKKASAFLVEQATSLSKAIASALEAQASAEDEGADITSERISLAIKALEEALTTAIACGREY